MAYSSVGPNNSSNGGSDAYENSVIRLTKQQICEDGSNKITIDVKKLRKIFLNPNYEDCLVAVYAIAGPFRSGKSFLLNLLIPYLCRLERGDSGECSASEEIENCFETKGGRKPQTEGIHILRKPFLLDIKQHGKLKKVALFLMDTQGLFDLKASTEKMTVIGTLSFLMSSLQCFNVKEQIHRIHLEHIYKFAQMAKDVKEQDEENSLIEQGSLMFIVRDWFVEEHDNYSFGFEGGKKYFKEAIEPEDGHAEEHEMMKEYLDDTFGEIPCCLLPYPGEAVRRKNLGAFGELDEEFQIHINKWIKVITDPNNLLIKKFDGKEVTCAELCCRMEAFASMLKRNIILEDVRSLIQADYEARMNCIATTCAKGFLRNIQNEAESFRKESSETIKRILVSKARNAIKKYKESRKCGGEDFQRVWQNEFENLLQQISDGMEACAVAEKRYVELITDFNKWRKQAVADEFASSEDFKRVASEKREELLTMLKQTVRKDLFEQCGGYFRRDINKLLAETEDDVREYLEKLELPWWKAILVMGALVVTEKFLPFANEAAKKFATDITSSHRQNVRNEFLKAKHQNPTEQMALGKYEESEINVRLCFGEIGIFLKSKVKLSD